MKSRKIRSFVISILLAGTITFSAMLLSSCSKSVEKMKSNGDVEGLIEAATYELHSYSDEINEKRDSAREALLEIGAPAIEPLINTLQSDDQSVVEVAIALLGEIKDPKAAEGLIEYRFYSSKFRYPARDTDAESALYNIGPAAIDPMIDALKSDNLDAVRFAFDFLENFVTEYDPKYVETLIELSQKEEFREAALYTLSKSGDPSIMGFMMEYMDQEIVADGYFTEINVQYIQPVLDGQGITATPYQTNSPSPHPVVVSDESPFIGFRVEPEYDEHNNLKENWNAYLPLPWRALGEPESIQLVLSWDEIDTEVIETAKYNDGSTGTREVQLYTVTLREAATGNVVVSEILRGVDPKPMPSKKQFNEIVHYIGKLTPRILINWLYPYVSIININN